MTGKAIGKRSTVSIPRSRNRYRWRPPVFDHIQRHINQQVERLQRIDEEQKTLAQQSADDELQQLKELQQGLDDKETRLQQTLEVGLEGLAEQRANNADLSAQQDDSREALQQSRAELATLQSVQEAAYGGSNEQVMKWLQQTGLDGKTRLAQNLQVDSGWERAVESILGHFLEAVCIENDRDYASKLNQLVAGRITLITDDNTAAHDADDERLLINRIQSSSNLSGLLNQVYVANDLQSAMTMRASLPAGATIVTADGVCLGHGWVRAAVENNKEGLLQREQHIQALAASITEMQTAYTLMTEQLTAGRTKYLQLEDRRDENQDEINTLHRQLSEVRAEINSRETALQQINERVQRLHADLENIQTEVGNEKTELESAQQTLTQSGSRQKVLQEEKARLSDTRDAVIQTLQRARDEISQSGEQTNRIAMQLESLQNQFQSMQRHHEQMLEQQTHLQERKARLEQPSNEDGEPLAVIEGKRDRLLEERQVIEQELTQARQQASRID